MMGDRYIPQKGAAVADGSLDAEIFAYWSAGRTNAEIARALGVPEAAIVIRLPQVLDARRGLVAP